MKCIKTGMAVSSRRESSRKDIATELRVRCKIVVAFLTAIGALTICGCSQGGGHAATGIGAVLGSGQKFSFLRKYTVGDKDVYAATMDMGKSTKSTMTETQSVTKVYDDGTADVSMAISDMKMQMNGKDTPIPTAAVVPVTMHYDKYGAPTESKDASGGAAMPFSFSDMSVVHDGINLGQTVPFNTPAKNGIQSKGTLTFVEVTDGAAKLHIVSDSTKDGKPNGHIDGMMYMEMSTAKLSKADLTLGTPAGESMHMTMARKAS